MHNIDATNKADDGESRGLSSEDLERMEGILTDDDGAPNSDKLRDAQLLIDEMASRGVPTEDEVVEQLISSIEVHTLERQRIIKFDSAQ